LTAQSVKWARLVYHTTTFVLVVHELKTIKDYPYGLQQRNYVVSIDEFNSEKPEWNFNRVVARRSRCEVEHGDPALREVELGRERREHWMASNVVDVVKYW